VNMAMPSCGELDESNSPASKSPSSIWAEDAAGRRGRRGGEG
jgi:hypothetical protein